VATILNVTEPLGAFQLGDEIDFFKNLNEFIQVMQKAMGYQEKWNIFTDKMADEIKLLKIIKSGTMKLAG
jgi:hypothetical protein